MKALDLLKNNEEIFVEDTNNKKVNNLVSNFKNTLADLNSAISNFEN